MLGVRIDSDLESKIKKYTKKTGHSKSYVVKEALVEFLRNRTEADRHDRLTLKGWQQVGNGEGLPVDEIYSYLGTWGAEEEI